MPSLRNILLCWLTVSSATGYAWDFSARVALDNYTRLDSSSTLGRATVEWAAKYSLLTSKGTEIDFSAEGRAWMLYSAGTNPEQDWYQFGPRNTYVTITKNNLRLRMGYQLLNWGETFGLPPSDVMNPRDYRNFDFLDSPRNKISIPLATLSYTIGESTLQAFFSPKGNGPKLPKKLGGIAVNDSKTTNAGWLDTIETGARFSWVLSSMNFDLSYQYLANRFPVLDLSVAATGPELIPVMENVHSFGFAFSKGFEEVVLRADARYTLDSPVGISAGVPTRTYHDAFSTVVGADWSPGFIDGFLIGAQAQLDRYPLPGTTEQIGANALARKSFWNEKLEVEGMYFQGFRFKDRFIQASTTMKPFGTWSGKLFFQSFLPDAVSPLRFVGSYDRMGGEIAYSF